MFIPRLGYAQHKLVDSLAAEGARCTAASLYYTHANPELALIPATARLGVVLDPMTHIRERPLAARAPIYRAQPWGRAAAAFDPDRSSISDVELEQLATDPIELQRGRGATLMLTSYHVAASGGTRGRDLDLLLAEVGISHFRRERIDEPPEHATIAVPREIYATLAIRVQDLHDAQSRRRLAEAYLALESDGLWVKLFGFHEAADPRDIQVGASFLRELSEGGRALVSDGAGQLHLGLLALNVSASIGIADSERCRYPTDWKRASAGSESKGRSRNAYHPSFMRSFKLGGDPSRKAFAASRCRCGQHPPEQPPTHTEVGPHAAVVRMRQAADALDGDGAERRECVLASATKATWAEKDAGIPSRGVLGALTAVFTGWDAAPSRVASSA